MNESSKKRVFVVLTTWIMCSPTFAPYLPNVFAFIHCMKTTLTSSEDIQVKWHLWICYSFEALHAAAAAATTCACAKKNGKMPADGCTETIVTHTHTHFRIGCWRAGVDLHVMLFYHLVHQVTLILKFVCRFSTLVQPPVISPLFCWTTNLVAKQGAWTSYKRVYTWNIIELNWGDVPPWKCLP